MNTIDVKLSAEGAKGGGVRLRSRAKWAVIVQLNSLELTWKWKNGHPRGNGPLQFQQGVYFGLNDPGCHCVDSERKTTP